jgi:hypothetical protein
VQLLCQVRLEGIYPERRRWDAGEPKDVGGDDDFGGTGDRDAERIAVQLPG